MNGRTLSYSAMWWTIFHLRMCSFKYCRYSVVLLERGNWNQCNENLSSQALDSTKHNATIWSFYPSKNMLIVDWNDGWTGSSQLRSSSSWWLPGLAEKTHVKGGSHAKSTGHCSTRKTRLGAPQHISPSAGSHAIGRERCWLMWCGDVTSMARGLWVRKRNYIRRKERKDLDWLD